MFKGELAFLNTVRRPEGGFRRADWLLTEFSSNEWSADFAKGSPVRWSFDVPLYDGSRLTDPQHGELLDTLKQWLCAQTHPSVTGRPRLHPTTSFNRIARTFHLIDYLLLHGGSLSLATHGLRLLTANDIRSLIGELAATRLIEESAYAWSERARSYLVQKAQAISARSIADACNEVPEIEETCDEVDCDLSLTSTEQLHVRVWLWQNGLYSRRRSKEAGNAFVPDMVAISSAVYERTIWGRKLNFSIPFELCFGSDDKAPIEMVRVPTSDAERDVASRRQLATYVTALGGLRIVALKSKRVPFQAFAPLDEDHSQTLDLKGLGRFTPLPQEVVWKALRASIEFSLRYGDDLVDAYHAVTNEMDRTGRSLASVVSQDFSRFLSPKLQELGVRRWSILWHGHVLPDGETVFTSLRRNDGLYELLRVLVGSVHVCVGTLMARRAGELDDLVPGEALDAQQANLIFRNRKSGESSHRAIEARPIPPLGAKLIRMLERLHVINQRKGSGGAPLFTYPAKYTGKLVTNGCRSYACLDQFSDYFELPGREPGTRYYLRQHQLRQFFAVCFFWSSGFGGLDTLRWFLGHMDPRHVWHYISRSVPGEILRVVQVDYAIQKVRSGSADAESLAELLVERYGTRDFSVIETPELQRYLDRLVQNGDVRIEPEFFESDCGETFRIVILVKGARPELAQHG